MEGRICSWTRSQEKLLLPHLITCVLPHVHSLSTDPEIQLNIPSSLLSLPILISLILASLVLLKAKFRENVEHTAVQ